MKLLGQRKRTSGGGGPEMVLERLKSAQRPKEGKSGWARVQRQVCVTLQTSLQTAGKSRDLFDYNGVNNKTKARVWEENRGKCHREPD